MVMLKALYGPNQINSYSVRFGPHPSFSAATPVLTFNCSCWRGPQMRLGLLTTAIFGDLGGYFFGNFRDKASNNDDMLPLVGL